MQQGKARGRFARAAITAALTGAMALGGVVGPVGTALADGGATITFKTAEGDVQRTQYNKAIKVFSAAEILNSANEKGGLALAVQWIPEAQQCLIGDNDEYNASAAGFLTKGVSETGASQTYIAWLVANNKLRGDNATKSAYADLDRAGRVEFNKAANAAQYIGEEIKKSNDNGSVYDTQTTEPNKPKVTSSDSFANKLAAALSGLESASTATFSGGSLTLSETGYYVLTSNSGAVPIWLPFDVDDGPIDLYEKAKIPTFEKRAYEALTITNPDDDNYVAPVEANVIDAGNEDAVTFTLTAKLPAGTYDRVVFTDYLPKNGFTLDDINLKVYAGEGDDETDVTSQFTYEELSTATVDGVEYLKFEVRKKLNENQLYETEEETTFTVRYTVNVTESAGMGQDYNTNKADFSYGDGQHVSTESEAKVVSYGLKVVKVDADTGEVLGGAKFAIQDVGDDSNTKGLYVINQKGQMDRYREYDYVYENVEDASIPQFTTIAVDEENEGTFQISTVDATTYKFIETYAPTTDHRGNEKSYEKIDDFTVSVTPTYDQGTGELTALAATVAGVDGKETMASVSADATTGIVTVTVPNGESEVRLPITGMTPSQLGTVAGMVLVAAGAFMVLRRRQADQA